MKRSRCTGRLLINAAQAVGARNRGSDRAARLDQLRSAPAASRQ
jgi:hypothetical protein